MLLTHWEPFEVMRSMEREFNEMVNRAFAESPETSARAWMWRPAVEVFRDGDDLVVRAELPGVDPERDVEVTIEGNVLQLKGHRSFDREVSDDRRYMVERAYGEFRRDIALPEGVDADKLEASYEDGVLTVTVPLPEALKAAEPKKIPVAVSKMKKLLGGNKD